MKFVPVRVNEDLDVGAILWHGRLADFPRDWRNEAQVELMVIENFHKQPSGNVRSFSRWADVNRFRDELPDQE